MKINEKINEINANFNKINKNLNKNDINNKNDIKVEEINDI